MKHKSHQAHISLRVWMNFRRGMKQFRWERGWGQGEMGRHMGLSRKQIVNLEKGYCWPSEETLKKYRNLTDHWKRKLAASLKKRVPENVDWRLAE